MKKKNFTADEIAYMFYKDVYNRDEHNEISKWTNDTYYNSDGIYREPKLDTMEELIAFIKQFSGNLTAMAYLNYYDSLK
jgi:hypothetical protein